MVSLVAHFLPLPYCRRMDWLSEPASGLCGFRFIVAGHPCCSNCGRRTRPFGGRAFREHGSNVGVLPFLFPLLFRSSIEGVVKVALDCASDEHRFIVRVLRARRAPGHSLSHSCISFSAPPHNVFFLGACPTLTVLLRRTMISHLLCSRP
jgi:hypothetical protein